MWTKSNGVNSIVHAHRVVYMCTYITITGVWVGTCTVFLKIIIEYFITDAYAAATTTTEAAAADSTYIFIGILYYTVNATSVHIPRAQSR